MYHIKEDKRAQASVELICDGLKRCLKEKSFESVTISDIQRVSGVSRSTFYRNFDRGDMLYASLRRCTSRMRSGLPEWGDAALLDYLASIIASSMMGIMITWVERGKKENEEEFKGMILQSFKAMKFIGLM